MRALAEVDYASAPGGWFDVKLLPIEDQRGRPTVHEECGTEVALVEVRLGPADVTDWELAWWEVAPPGPHTVERCSAIRAAS